MIISADAETEFDASTSIIPSSGLRSMYFSEQKDSHLVATYMARGGLCLLMCSKE